MICLPLPFSEFICLFLLIIFGDLTRAAVFNFKRNLTQRYRFQPPWGVKKKLFFALSNVKVNWISLGLALSVRPNKGSSSTFLFPLTHFMNQTPNSSWTQGAGVLMRLQQTLNQGDIKPVNWLLCMLFSSMTRLYATRERNNFTCNICLIHKKGQILQDLSWMWLKMLRFSWLSNSQNH